MFNTRLTTILLASALLLYPGCDPDGGAIDDDDDDLADDDSGDDDSGDDDSGDDDDDTTDDDTTGDDDDDTAAIGWIDVHLHCGERTPDCSQQNLAECCPIDGFADAIQAHGPGYGVMLSLEHYAVASHNGDIEDPDLAWGFEHLNDIYALAVNSDPNLFLFASLSCWHDTPFDDPGWVDACKADADEWAAAGAVGFKDHIGKARHDPDYAVWLGSWNRFNGYCTVEPDDPEPSRTCMTQPGVVYPALEPAWREVLVYITETLGMPVLTHATTYPSDPQEATCYDPLTGLSEDCGTVTRSHLLDMGHWAEGELSVQARRRIVVAHLGFYFEDEPGFQELLDTGLSVDTSAQLWVVATLGCDGRSVMADHGGQILFGSDIKTDSSYFDESYAAYFHAFQGGVDDLQTFQFWDGPQDVIGMDLDTPVVPGCAYDVPPGTLERVLRVNALEIVGAL